ncbi:hypothetical protein MMC30_009269 [Trapelia coarctata]|nr:hypothetical protein [Trapelia coarctata]
MPQKDEVNGSREGLLHEHNEASSRSSSESRSSEDDGLDELEVFEYADEIQNKRHGRGKTRTLYSYAKSPGARRRWLKSLGNHFWQRRSCLTITLVLIGALVGVLSASGVWVYKSAPPDGLSPPWYPTPRGGALESWTTSYKKATDMVNMMSLVEKVNITTGTGWSMGFCVGNTGPAASVGFPPLCLQDGPLGIRFSDHSTAFPAGITVGATWNRVLMYKRGRAHALEARLKGINILLGPSMGPLGKLPAGGRNWEGFGSDPVLQGVAAAATIRGIQDEGVIATAKHFVGNEQEHFRQSFEWGLPNAMSSNIDDRTLHELYLWPFAESIKAGVASVMCSYQMVNNSYACSNSKLMNGILKDELGFSGFVQSDWLAQRSGVGSALAGLDMSMPGDGLQWMNGKSLWGPQLTLAVLNGSMPMERLNDMATRIVAAWYQLGQDNKTVWPAPPPEGDGGPNFSSWTDDEIGPIHYGSDDKATAVVNKFVDVQGTGNDFHGRLAQIIAAEGTVLVKNEDHILPLRRSGWPDSTKKKSKYRIGIFGEDAGPGRGPNVCADRGCNQGTLASGWGSGAVEFPYLVTPATALESAFDLDTVDLTTYLSNEPTTKDAKTLIENQDLCFVFINADGGEGFITGDGIRADRDDLYPQKGGDKLVQAVAKSCGKGHSSTIVVVHAVGPVVMEKWIDLTGVKAVLLANLPGEESGNALAAVLFGDIDASGRLPYTVGKSLADYGPGGQVMYYPDGVIPQQDFKEGLLIDYRHFDKYAITPRYEFGFGLSYTTFTFTNLVLRTIKPKYALPDARPIAPALPAFDNSIPNPSTALFPKGFRKLNKYIYPYISSTADVKHGQYPYPTGYSDQQPPSPAGGGEGGNPSLYELHLNVSVTITNTGSRKGKEVVQLYLSFPDNVVEEETGERIEFPVKVLRAFEKVEVEKGEQTTVMLGLTRKDLSYWSVVRQNWVMPMVGKFTVRVGRSSRDLGLEGTW